MTHKAYSSMNMTINLLLIEVSEPDAQTVVRRLSQEGFSVSEKRVETRGELAAALDTRSWDLVISDYEMPAISAAEALSVLREKKSELPLIVVSDLEDEEKQDQILRAGAIDFLNKAKLHRLAPIIERELFMRTGPDSEYRESEWAHPLEKALALAEKAQLESEERYRALASCAHQVWTVKSGETDVIPETVTSESPSRSDLDPLDWVRSIHPDDRDEFHEEWLNALENKEVFEIETRIQIVPGIFRHFYVRAVPVFHQDNTVREWIGMNFDTTERQLAEAELRKSEAKLLQIQKLESVGQLAGGIAHDFNNMLTAINGYCDLALRKIGEDDPLHKYISEIKKSGDRSALLTQQLLAFSRKQVLHPTVIDINQVIRDTGGMLRRLIGEDITLKTRLSGEIHPVRVDPGQLSQVIMNLAVNARDAMPGGGRLLIETANVYFDELYGRVHLDAKIGHYVMLAVSDTGTGIESEIQKKIFEPFFSTKESSKGTGLGLSTVYGIVKQSGGYVWLYSEVGHGSIFKVYFPMVADKIEKPPEPEMPVMLKKGNETILLVEDEFLVRNLCREVLESSGYQVFEANDGIEALEIFFRHRSRIDLLMTDIVMPKMGGRILAEKIQSYNPSLPILYMSGYTDDMVIRSGVIEENVNYLQKPFNYNDLATKIRYLLD